MSKRLARLAAQLVRKDYVAQLVQKDCVAQLVRKELPLLDKNLSKWDRYGLPLAHTLPP